MPVQRRIGSAVEIRFDLETRMLRHKVRSVCIMRANSGSWFPNRCAGFAGLVGVLLAPGWRAAVAVMAPSSTG